MPKADEAIEQPTYAPYAAETSDGNVSMLTGKSWGDMNEVERVAHSIARGTDYANNADPVDVNKARVYIANSVGSGNIDDVFEEIRTEAEVRTAPGGSNYTTDARYEEMVFANTQDNTNNPTPAYEAPPPDPFSNPDQTTGYWDDNSKVTMFDPMTGEYITKDVDPDNIMQYNPRGDESMYGIANGRHELIYTGAEGARDTGAMVDDGPGMNGQTWTWGAEAPPPIQWRDQREGDLSFGGDQVPVRPGDPEWVDPGDGGGGTTVPGGGDGGGGGTVIPGPGANDDPWDPGAQLTFDPPGYEGGYDWNWEAFQPGAPSLVGGGGYDPADFAFDRYVPGQESPWGIPDIEGGNKDFYRNQFLNLLKEEQGFSQKQRDSQAQMDFAQDNPLEAAPLDWSWLDDKSTEAVEGLPDPFRMPYGSVEQGDSFGYSTETPKYILNPTMGEASMYVSNPAFTGTGGRTSGRGR